MLFRHCAPLTMIASRACAAGIALLSLSACQTQQPPSQQQPTLVMSRLDDSAKRIADAMEKLQRASASAAPQNLPPPIDPALAPEPLRLAVTWEDWRGDLEQALRGIASRIGYRVLVHGEPPAALISVSVSVKDVPAIQVLENLGWQAGERAVVRLDPPTPVIHLYYTPIKTGLQKTGV